jgi:hypothetical protein
MRRVVLYSDDTRANSMSYIGWMVDTKKICDSKTKRGLSYNYKKRKMLREEADLMP